MARSIVKYNHRFLLYLKREPVKIIHKFFCIDGFLCQKAFIPVSYTHLVDMNNILTVNSVPRSKLMSEVLQKTGLVERSAQEVEKMFYNLSLIHI